jgi:hypothetical protein
MPTRLTLIVLLRRFRPFGGERRNFPTLKEAMMKKIVVAVSAMTLLTSGIAYAQATTPGIDQRQANQERRIDQGITSGQLTEREAARLDKQQNHIDNMENKAKADGVMTKKERARIHAAQDRASRSIARQKHDAQGKRHR